MVIFDLMGEKSYPSLPLQFKKAVAFIVRPANGELFVGTPSFMKTEHRGESIFYNLKPQQRGPPCCPWPSK